MRMSLKPNEVTREDPPSSEIIIQVRRDTRVCRFVLPSPISGHGETMAFSARKEVTNNLILDLKGSSLLELQGLRYPAEAACVN